jgi:hypothetical protein
VSQVTLARNRSLDVVFLVLAATYGCGGCRILQSRAAGQYVESAGLVKTTAAPPP